MVVAVMLGLVACQDELPGQPADTPISVAASMPEFWKTAPSSDDKRWELLRRIRAIDVCALIPRSVLARFGEPLRVEIDDPDSCSATFGSLEHGKGTEISWALGVAPRGYTWGETKRDEVDGITVGMLRDLDASPQLEGQLTERSCSAIASFANTVTLPLRVSTPLGTEPCPAAQAALTQAMSALADEPAQGTSPDTPDTVLLGEDPCAVATALGVQAPVLDQRLWGCQFSYRDGTVDVDYTYDSEGLVVRGEPLFVVNGHKAYGDPDIDSEFGSYAAVLGPELPGPDTYAGPNLPVVRVFGSDRANVEAVLRATTELFPAR
ncbi:hypothetical protein BOX37_23080 [Nocardia mangyaensis]|uniref:DUF3558 domain-containing protein n=2 Tax=Nocardia mangyaensis TaxID=2213200 RepID=A0A1J0VWF5_9NOCA|nr:hypothetical protein BOX37_23080 [Nocardia mangyaensis]